MAIRPKTPGTPAQRNKTVSGQGDAAPAKPKVRRTRSPAAERPEPETVDATLGIHVSEAIRALGERVAAGIDMVAELRDEVRTVNRRLDQLAAGRAQSAVMWNADDYPFGRDRDPGDAVPPGVAATTPTPLTDNDEAVLHTLEDLPKRPARGRRGPRAKA
jgi:hypothetical protein